MKKLVVLGSTGSIGRQTLDIARAFPDVFRVVGLAAGTNVTLLQEQIEEFQPEMAYCASSRELHLPADARWVSMEEMTTRDDVDLVMAATNRHRRTAADVSGLGVWQAGGVGQQRGHSDGRGVA